MITNVGGLYIILIFKENRSKKFFIEIFKKYFLENFAEFFIGNISI